MRWWPCVVGLLIAVPAMGTTGDVLVVSTDDAELSQALVRAASQQFSGPVAQAPLDWSSPVKEGTLRLQVQAQSGGWHVVLAGPLVSVARDLKVTSHVRLDVAEAIALALPGLQNRLDGKAQDAQDARDRERARLKAAALKPAPVLVTPVLPPPPPPPVVVPPPVREPEPPPRPIKPVEEPVPAPLPLPPAPVKKPEVHSIVEGDAGLTVGAGVLAASALTAAGGEVSSQVRLHGPWLARLSFGTYGAPYTKGAIWLMPIDVVAGVRATGGPVHFDFALGGEVNVVVVPAEAGLVTAFVAQATASVHLTPSWSIGLRAAGAFTTDAGDSVSGRDANAVYIPQAQFRINVIALWESTEQT